MVEPPRPEPARGDSPREAVVEGARAEHRYKRGGVDPGRDGREHAVCEHDEHDTGGDRAPRAPRGGRRRAGGGMSSIVHAGIVARAGPTSRAARIERCSTTPSAAAASPSGCGRRASSLLFLGLSADLEYLSGVERGIPFFGQSSYAHGWVAGGFFRPDADPVFVLPRMVVDVRPARPSGGRARRRRTRPTTASASSSGSRRASAPRASVAIGDRVWAETTLNLGRDLRLRAAPNRLVARQRAPAREDRRGARRRWAVRAAPSSRRWRRSPRRSCRA